MCTRTVVNIMYCESTNSPLFPKNAVRTNYHGKSLSIFPSLVYTARRRLNIIRLIYVVDICFLFYFIKLSFFSCFTLFQTWILVTNPSPFRTCQPNWLQKCSPRERSATTSKWNWWPARTKECKTYATLKALYFPVIIENNKNVNLTTIIHCSKIFN